MIKDMTGLQFTNWTVVKRAGTRTHTKSKPALWEVRCKCGVVSIVAGTDLRSGQTKGCGCSMKGPHPEKIGVYSRNKHHAWKGGRQTDKKGYIWLSISQIKDFFPNASWPEDSKRRKMLEHRAAMSHHLGRPLYDNETVHHRNGDRSDNRIENLELKAGKHGPGQTIEDQVAWAKEILRRYT